MRLVFHSLCNTIITQYMLARHTLWYSLHAVQPHPISRHIQRQANKQPSIPIFSIVIVSGFVLFFLYIALFTRIGVAVLLLLPLWLILFSASYIVPWIYRVGAVIKGQYRDGVRDVVGVIPLGGVFVTVGVCHVIMNESDQLGWLRYLRWIIVLFVLVAIGCSILIAAMNIQAVTINNTVRIIIDIWVLSVLLYIEHQQSILIACFLAILVPKEESNPSNLVSTLIMSFGMIQFVTWMIPLLAIIVASTPSMMLMNMIFILIREGFLFLMWHRTRLIQ